MPSCVSRWQGCLRAALPEIPSELHSQRQPVHSWRAEIGVQSALLIHSVEYHLRIFLIKEVLRPRLNHPALVLRAKAKARVHKRIGVLILARIEIRPGVVMRSGLRSDIAPPEQVGPYGP